MFGIYIHIPFCLKKCVYCDFHSVAVKPIPQKEYVSAVRAELEQQVEKYDLRGRTVDTIYFGGGTPTIFEPRYIEQLLNYLSTTFKLSPNAEISIEANPETIRTLVRSCYRAIVQTFNRISIGIQTFNDIQLKKLGRVHDSKTAKNAVRAVQDAGFKNIGIDLMWGLPDQKIEDLELDLDEAIKLSPQHISAYQLTLSDHVAAKFALPSEDLAREMFLIVHNTLTSSGYEHYEISNFAKIHSSDFNTSTLKHLNTVFRCQHNLNYWHYGKWLGLGSGATSFINVAAELALPELGRASSAATRIRFTSTTNLSKYLRCEFEYETEEIDKKTAFKEYCFLGLRTSDGIDLNKFKEKHPKLADEWIKNGFAISKNERIFLTLEGMLISDELFKNLCN